MIKIAFLTSTVSPFWFDFSKAVLKKNIDFKIFYSQSAVADGRPSHWDNWNSADSEFKTFAELAPPGISKAELASWYLNMLKEWKPDVVIASTYKPWVMNPAVIYTNKIVPLGLWAEKPLPISPLLKWAKEVVIKSQMKNVDFCLAIGDLAEEVYKRLMPGDKKVFMLPYSQDLSDFESEHPIDSGRSGLNVLFSGQLIKRHNIKMIAEAIEILHSENSESSEINYTFSGAGAERVHLDKLKDKHPALDNSIKIIDKPFNKWEDRANPYLEADILLYPSRYSGWGLVVPEAMAAGLPVISTKKVDAARYFIKHGVNGIFIEETSTAIAGAIKKFHKNKDMLKIFSSSAKESSRKGRADYVANDFVNVVSYILSK